MPKATVSTQSQEFDLKSVPGGKITLKRMTYGEWLHRRDLSMAMSFGSDSSGSEIAADMKLQNQAVSLFELQKCVVSSNLTEDDEETIPLDFSSPSIMDKIDPIVGTEIDTLIASMHDFEASLKN
jgi:hypothetical protein